MSYKLGGGTGGGPTLTEVVEASPTNGQVITVVHPPVPLSGAGSGNIQISGLFTVPGTGNTTDYVSAWTKSVTLTANWYQDSISPPYIGHFVVAPDPRVVPGANIGSLGFIRTIGADPTIPGSVGLEGGSPETGMTDIIVLQGGYFGGGVLNLISNGYSVPALYPDWGGEFTYAYTSSIANQTTISNPPLPSVFRMRGNTGGTTGNHRVAVSLDGGISYLSYSTGAGWHVIDLSNLGTEGMQVVVGNTLENWLGVAGETADWATFAGLISDAGAALDVRWAGGFDVAGEPRILGAEFYYGSPSAVQPAFKVSEYGQDSGFSGLARTSTTEVNFVCKTPMGDAPTDWHCQVWTS